MAKSVCMSLSPLQQAVLFAAERHKGEVTDLGLPYVCHPLQVLENLRASGEESEPMLVAAVLHDTVESGNAEIKEIARLFGADAAGLVRELTRTEPDTETAEGLSPTKLQRLRFDLLLTDIDGMSSEAQSVKLADRLANLLQALETKRGKKKDRYLEQSREVLNHIPKKANRKLWKQIDSLLKDHDR